MAARINRCRKRLEREAAKRRPKIGREKKQKKEKETKQNALALQPCPPVAGFGSSQSCKKRKNKREREKEAESGLPIIQEESLYRATPPRRGTGNLVP
jgi:hypothetical protein